MNPVLKIGFLVPYSFIYPGMSHDVIDGFMTSIPEKYMKNFQFYPEFVNLGNDNDVTMAVNKLIMFHNVDVLSGFLSYLLLPVVVPLLARKNKLCFFFDMGEYLPPLTKLPATFFFNSYKFWQLEYALENWAQKSLGGKGAILMSVYYAPHMASDVILSKIDNLGLQFYSASGWSYKDKSDNNQKFIKQYEAFLGRKATEFAVMGYEMSLAFLPVLPQLQSGDIASVIRFLKEYHIDGPRGKRNFWIDNKIEQPVVEIEKIALQPLNTTKLVVEQGEAMKYNHAVFEEIHNGCVSGWRNPYLCI